MEDRLGLNTSYEVHTSDGCVWTQRCSRWEYNSSARVTMKANKDMMQYHTFHYMYSCLRHTKVLGKVSCHQISMNISDLA